MAIIHNNSCPIQNAKRLGLPPRHLGVPWFQIPEIIEYVKNKKNIDDINFEINSEIIRLQNEYFNLKQNKITEENESKEINEIFEIINSVINKNVKTVWLQLEIFCSKSEKKLKKLGINFIQNRCTKIEYEKIVN